MATLRNPLRYLALLLGLTALLTAPVHAAGQKWALLVGVNDYESDDIVDLLYAVPDIRAVAGALRVGAGFAEETVVVMTSDLASGPNRPTNVNVLKRLDTLARQIGPED